MYNFISFLANFTVEEQGSNVVFWKEEEFKKFAPFCSIDAIATPTIFELNIVSSCSAFLSKMFFKSFSFPSSHFQGTSCCSSNGIQHKKCRSHRTEDGRQNVGEQISHCSYPARWRGVITWILFLDMDVERDGGNEWAKITKEEKTKWKVIIERKTRTKVMKRDEESRMEIGDGKWEGGGSADKINKWLSFHPFGLLDTIQAIRTSDWDFHSLNCPSLNLVTILLTATFPSLMHTISHNEYFVWNGFPERTLRLSLHENQIKFDWYHRIVKNEFKIALSEHSECCGTFCYFFGTTKYCPPSHFAWRSHYSLWY